MVMSPAGLGPENDCAGEGPGKIVNDRSIISSERILHKDYNPKCSAKKKHWSWISERLVAEK
jgi:hypothetical protein